MEICERILFYFVLSIVLKDVFGELKCSQCVSKGHQTCIVNPPPAEPCSKYFQRKGPLNCIIAKITNTSGSILEFIRGCTQVWTGSGCIYQPDNTSLCYNICSTNSCNNASKLKSGLIMYLVMSFFIWNY